MKEYPWTELIWRALKPIRFFFFLGGVKKGKHTSNMMCHPNDSANMHLLFKVTTTRISFRKLCWGRTHTYQTEGYANFILSSGLHFYFCSDWLPIYHYRLITDMPTKIQGQEKEQLTECIPYGSKQWVTKSLACLHLHRGLNSRHHTMWACKQSWQKSWTPGSFRKWSIASLMHIDNKHSLRNSESFRCQREKAHLNFHGKEILAKEQQQNRSR